ncbi:MAG: DUF1697 domain-containing protein [Burkholderiaceae bacterium]
MSRCIAFLRAVNVGGRIVKMGALKAQFEALALTDVSTFIASGNVIFETRARDMAALEQKIEKQLHGAFGFEVHSFVRSAAELAAIAACRPFEQRELEQAAAFVVGFVARPLDAAQQKIVSRFNNEVDAFCVQGRELFWMSRHRQSDSKFSNAAFERALGLRATFRNMNTVQRIAALNVA